MRHVRRVERFRATSGCESGSLSVSDAGAYPAQLHAIQTLVAAETALPG
jgi:hypothetical protein